MGGTAYLALVTELLQRARLDHPTAGLWEAADLQWWFTRDPHPGDEDAAYETCWMDAADRPARRDLPPGYALVPRPEQTGPHPMIGRNGAEVEPRLRQCPLYDPGLDLAVRAPDGTVAAYALFWPDLRTGVGLVEPMRVEDGHAGRGIGGVLLRAGLHGLAARGCARLKVSHDLANTTARRLYPGTGFRPAGRTALRWRPPAGQPAP